jgi:hypothetical protein
MSVIEAADEAIRCLQRRLPEVSVQIDQLAPIEAEIDGMTDVLELQVALHRCVRLSNELLRMKQKVGKARSPARGPTARRRRSWRRSSASLPLTRRRGVGMW